MQIVDKCNAQEPAVQQQVGAGRLLGWLSLSLCVCTPYSKFFVKICARSCPYVKIIFHYCTVHTPALHCPLPPYDAPPTATHSLAHSLTTRLIIYCVLDRTGSTFNVPKVHSMSVVLYG